MQYLIILIYVSYFTEIYQIFSIGTYGVTATDVLILLFYILLIKKIVWDGEGFQLGVRCKEFGVKNRESRVEGGKSGLGNEKTGYRKLILRFNSPLIFLIIIILAVIISGLVPLINNDNEQILQYFKTTSHLLFLMILPVAACVFHIDLKIWTNVIKAWIIISIFINLFGIYQIAARGYGLPLAWLDITNVSYSVRGTNEMDTFSQISVRFENFYRATSIFSEPSGLALFNLYILTFIYIPYIQGKKQFLKSRILNVTIFLIAIVTLFLTFSLTAFLGLGLIMLAMIIFNFSKKMIKLMPIAAISVLVVMISNIVVREYTNVNLIELFVQRIISVTTTRESSFVAGESFKGRLEGTLLTLKAWERNPMIGTGLGLIVFSKETKGVYGNTSVITVLAETGIFGFIGFVGLFISLFIITGKYINKGYKYKELPDDAQRMMGILFYIMIIQFMINFISANPLVTVHLWLFITIVVSVIFNVEHKLNKNFVNFKLFDEPLKIQLVRRIKVISC